jgi:hypothetical protein
MNVYLFVISALDAYLRDNDKMSVSVLTNSSKDLTAVETPYKKQDSDKDTDRDTDRDTDKDTDKNTDYKEDDRKEDTRKKTLALHSERNANENSVLEKLGSFQLAAGISSGSVNNIETDLVGSSSAVGIPTGSQFNKETGFVGSLDISTAAGIPVSPLNTPRSVRYVPNFDKSEFFKPKGSATNHCWKRTRNIVESLNKFYGWNLILEDGVKGTDFWGYKVMAYEPDAKVILTIGEDVTWAAGKPCQGLCEKSDKEGWHVYLYVASSNIGAPMVPSDSANQEQSN